jgi:hypothetical protein
MQRSELDDLVQEDLRQAVRTHRRISVIELELTRRVELLERGEAIVEDEA